MFSSLPPLRNTSNFPISLLFAKNTWVFLSLRETLQLEIFFTQKTSSSYTLCAKILCQKNKHCKGNIEFNEKADTKYYSLALILSLMWRSQIQTFQWPQSEVVSSCTTHHVEVVWGCILVWLREKSHLGNKYIFCLSSMATFGPESTSLRPLIM